MKTITWRKRWRLWKRLHKERNQYQNQSIRNTGAVSKRQNLYKRDWLTQWKKTTGWWQSQREHCKTSVINLTSRHAPSPSCWTVRNPKPMRLRPIKGKTTQDRRRNRTTWETEGGKYTSTRLSMIMWNCLNSRDINRQFFCTECTLIEENATNTYW